MGQGHTNSKYESRTWYNVSYRIHPPVLISDKSQVIHMSLPILKSNTGIIFPLKKKKHKKAFKVVWHFFTHKTPNETERVFLICLWLHSQWWEHCARQSISSYTESWPDSETEQPPSVCEDARRHQFLVSPIVLLPAAPAKRSRVTHLETKLPFLPNLLTYAKQSFRLYQLPPNSYTLFKIPNVMHSLETVSVLLNCMDPRVYSILLWLEDHHRWPITVLA